jgi:Protein of unknown function (DUF664)
MTEVDALAEPVQSLRDPRELLLAYLDAYREAVLRKLDGLGEAELRTSRLPSGWTPLELLKHLAYVELRWLRWGFAGEQVDAPWADAGPDDRWRVAGTESAAGIREFYLDQCARSRKIVAGVSLTEEAATGGRFDAGPPALGWILLHLLQEYARHLGHLDIARELADGTVGELRPPPVTRGPVARDPVNKRRHSRMRATAASVPSSLTRAARVLPIAHIVSSAGLPMTVTTGVAFLAVMRNGWLSPLPSSLANSKPTGALRSMNLAARRRRQSPSARPASSSRGCQSGAPRRTSSWCTKYSTVLARSSTPGIANTESRGGPDRKASMSCG